MAKVEQWNGNRPMPSPPGNVGEAELALFLDAMRLRGSPEESVRTFRHHLRPFLDHLREERVASLRETTRATVEAFVARMATELTRRGAKPLAPGTQTRRLAAVRSFCRFLVEQGLALVDPTEDVDPPREVQRLPTVLSSREVERLFAAPDLDTLLGYRDRAILETLYATGLRVTELAGLTLEDLRLAEWLVVVRQGKGRKDRVVPLGKRAGAFLRRYLERVRPELERGAAPKTAVFLTRTGKRFVRSDLEALFRRYAAKARLEAHTTPHALRHTCATDLLRRGADLRHIQEMLGHRRLATTQRYTHIAREELKRVHGRSHPREKLPLGEIRTDPRGDL